MSTVSEAEAPRSTRLSPIRNARGRSTNFGDSIFQSVVTVLAGTAPAILVLLTGLLLFDAKLSLQRYGISFFFTTSWDPVKEIFGAGHYVYGTFMTSAVALILAAPVAIGAALFLVEYAPGWILLPAPATPRSHVKGIPTGEDRL